MLTTVLLTAVLLSPSGAEAVASAGGSPVAALGSLVPAHHALHDFAGQATWFEYREPPAFRFEQPDFEAYVAGLEKAAADPGGGRFVAVWRDAGGALRHLLAKGDTVRLFSIDGDTVEFEDPGFHTQVGVARWGFEFDGGLLRAHRTWRLTLGPSGTGRPVGPPAPTALFAVTTYEYRKGARVPSRSRTFWNEADLRAGRWGQKSSYGADGKRLKTKHNPERPYPY